LATPSTIRLLPGITGLGALSLLALATAAAPLLVYSITLATLGLAHIAVEMRYVEGRFGPRLSRALVRGFLLLLGAVVVLRILRVAGLLGAEGAPLELVIVAGLVALVTVDLGAAVGPVRRVGALAIGIAAVLAIGAGLAPIPTLLLLGVLHNWTPLGFVAEATSGAERRRWLWLGAIAFIALPGLLASGVLHSWTEAWGLRDATVLPTGPLTAQLGAYLPRAMHAERWAIPVFSAITFAQCMHYAAVLGVLPLFAPRAPAGPLTRLSWPVYLGLILLGTLVLLAGYSDDFRSARQVYGIAAAVHAWVELPLLLLALRPRPA